MVIHIVPDEEDFDTVYQSLKNPPQYLALGRYEDLLDIERVDIVRIHPENEVDLKRDMYNPRMTIYNLTKEYEITKQGLRRWKKKNGRIKAYYCPQGMTLRKGAYVDNIEEDAAIVFC